jgi:hypothetical protein
MSLLAGLITTEFNVGSEHLHPHRKVNDGAALPATRRGRLDGVCSVQWTWQAGGGDDRQSAIRLLQERGGIATDDVLSDGQRLIVFDGLGEKYAHVTIDIGPGKAGAAIDVFSHGW